jgi:ornithine cyclodeaminase/alanine dehydrogenase-like protein (mu-crystallin family)
MTNTTIPTVDEEEIRRAVVFDLDALNAVEAAFVALAEGRASMPPVMHMSVRDAPGDIDVKGAVIEGLPIAAVKIAAGFFNNPLAGLRSSSGMMVGVSTQTGRPAVVLLDNGWLTDLRTALAGAVAARHLVARKHITVGVIGAGAQARYQVEALMIEFQIDGVYCFARRAEQGALFASDINGRLGLKVSQCRSIEGVLERADVVITTTPSTSSLIEAGMIRGEQHITAMGSDLPGKREIALAVLERADRLVCDDVPQSCRLGELQGASAETVARAKSLGDIVKAGKPQRHDPGLTVCDLTGLGVQDTAILNHAFRKMKL